MRVELKELNGILSDIDAAYHEAALKLGLSDSEYDILYLLCNYDGSCNQSTFYKETGMTRSTVNSAIRKLEKEEIVYLKPAEGRNTCVVLTEKGRQRVANTVCPMIEIENRIFNSWTERQRADYVELNRLYACQLRQEIAKL